MEYEKEKVLIPLIETPNEVMDELVENRNTIKILSEKVNKRNSRLSDYAAAFFVTCFGFTTLSGVLTLAPSADLARTIFSVSLPFFLFALYTDFWLPKIKDTHSWLYKKLFKPNKLITAYDTANAQQQEVIERYKEFLLNEDEQFQLLLKLKEIQATMPAKSLKEYNIFFENTMLYLDNGHMDLAFKELINIYELIHATQERDLQVIPPRNYLEKLQQKLSPSKVSLNRML